MNDIHLLILIPLITGSFFMFGGWIMLVFPPKKINWWYGYRTSSSTKNQERWDFAQRYSAKEMIKVGGFLLLTSVIGLVYQPNESVSTIIVSVLIITAIIALIVRVENAIKNRFSKR
ncbi:MAG: SdpI family protein [Cyclobacteriaceae bacterium]